ncbi:MAG: hypothetical protein JRI22_12800 [Deltaproteobacteria bacterium]|nr:hypothetical protein [Deltaproteobacteria bacterium]
MMRKNLRGAYFVSVAIMIASLGGCGYHFAGGRPSREVGQYVLAGPIIENHTRHPGLDLILAEAINHRFILEGRPLLKPTGETEARIRCSIRSLDIKPISFRRNLTAREYRITMVLDAALEGRGESPNPWRAKGLILTRTYRVQSTIVATEREKKAALEAIGFDAALIIADGILRGF